MPTYLMMTFLFLKVTVALKRITGQTQAAQTGPTLDEFDLLYLWYTSLQGGPVGSDKIPHKQRFFVTEHFHALFF
jgi:hypothetical protein